MSRTRGARVVRAGRAGRGFTLLELALASAMGLVVIFTATAVFTGLRAGWERSQERHKAALELSRLRVSLQEAFRTVVVLPKVRGRATAAAGGGAGAGGAGGVGGVATPINPDGSSGAPVNRNAGAAAGANAGAAATRGGAGARNATGALAGLPAGVDLGTEPEAGGASTGAAAGAGVSRAPRLVLERDALGVQRLELVALQSPAVARAADRSWTLANAEAGGGVRGAFELRPAADGRGWEVWWRTYALNEGPTGAGGAGGVPRVPLGEQRVARGFTRLKWSFVRSDEARQLQRLTEASATDPSEMPAYVELEVETVLGFKAQWMFEVGYVLAREQDALSDLPGELADRLAGIDPLTGEPREGGGGRGDGAGGPGGGGPGLAGPGGGGPGAVGPVGGGAGAWSGPVGERWWEAARLQSMDPALRGPGVPPWGRAFGPDGRPIRGGGG
jgi:hypothetical protein